MQQDTYILISIAIVGLYLQQMNIKAKEKFKIVTKASKNVCRASYSITKHPFIIKLPRWPQCDMEREKGL